jgi:hypothetical protein
MNAVVTPDEIAEAISEADGLGVDPEVFFVEGWRVAFRRAFKSYVQKIEAMKLKAFAVKERMDAEADARADFMASVVLQARRDGKKVTSKTWASARAQAGKVKRLSA